MISDLSQREIGCRRWIPLACCGLIWAALLLPCPCSAQPAEVGYQGELRKDGQLFTGSALFKFVIVDGAGNSLWSNDGTSQGGAEPQTAVPLVVTKGIFSTRLGAPPMVPLGADLIKAVSNPALRVWVNTGGAFERLTDQSISSSAFSLASDKTNQIGAQTTNFASKWDGFALVRSSIFDNGNVGIGTPNPPDKLTVEDAVGNAFIRVQAQSTTPNATYGGIKFGRPDHDHAALFYGAEGSSLKGFLSIWTNVGGQFYERMRVDNRGDVGIGTPTPDAPLDVFRPKDTVFDTLEMLRLTTWTGSGTSSILAFRDDGNGTWTLREARHERDMLTLRGYDGNVGIGTTDPNANLEVAQVVAGESSTLQLLGTYQGPDYDTLGQVRFKAFGVPPGRELYARITAETNDSGDGNLTFQTRLDGVGLFERMRIDRYGNVGIGTSAPAHSLHVSGSNASLAVEATAGGPAIRLQTQSNSPNASYGGIHFGRPDHQHALIMYGSEDIAEKGYLGFWTNNGVNFSERLHIAASGRVGIGVENPTAELEVSGKAKIVEDKPTDDGQVENVFRLETLISGGPSQSSILEFRDRGVGKWSLHDGRRGLDWLVLGENGNVGVGGMPGSGVKLDVTGLIRTSSVGFMFPDGTIQVTAAAGGQQGPPGPQGEQGPAGPAVTTVAACETFQGSCSFSHDCASVCAGSSYVQSQICTEPGAICYVTSDSGSCYGNEHGAGTWRGLCCVCRPH